MASIEKINLVPEGYTGQTIVIRGDLYDKYVADCAQIFKVNPDFDSSLIDRENSKQAYVVPVTFIVG